MKTTSINQNILADTLPNFCNLGVVLRILFAVNGMIFVASSIKTNNLEALMRDFVETAALVEPMLMMSLITLCPINIVLLRKISYSMGVVVVIVLQLVIVASVYSFTAQLYGTASSAPLHRYLAFGTLITVLLLAYFYLRNRAFSPAIVEARLQALQVRIRPHFLFNSLNAVLSLIRSQPKRAEQVLEELAHLFRVLMADHRALVTLKEEIVLCKQYLDIEQLRLGDRLHVEWKIEGEVENTLIPLMVLQPLLENAIYHGIEPLNQPGKIHIQISRKGNEVEIELRNPYSNNLNLHSGNKMALANIKERLSLHFDAEANLKSEAKSDVFEVKITLPYSTGD